MALPHWLCAAGFFFCTLSLPAARFTMVEYPTIGYSGGDVVFAATGATHMIPPLVLYHAQCPDGFASAWVAKRFFDGCNTAADFHPMGYGHPVPQHAAARDVVYVVDYCLPEPMLRELARTVGTVYVLDHHKTNLAVIDAVADVKNVKCDFRMEHSGAWLAWNHFFPTKPQHSLTLYAEDRDLWAWKLPYSAEVNAVLSSLPWSFDAWSGVADTLPATPDAVGKDHPLVPRGRSILDAQERMIEDHLAQSFEAELDGHKILAVNCTVLSIVSDLTGRLAEGRAFGLSWFVRKDGKAQVSLRSRGKTGLDVSEIARRHGGGGHAPAAGFQVDKGEPLPFLL